MILQIYALFAYPPIPEAKKNMKSPLLPKAIAEYLRIGYHQ
jgi:hypothetical protein